MLFEGRSVIVIDLEQRKPEVVPGDDAEGDGKRETEEELQR